MLNLTYFSKFLLSTYYVLGSGIGTQDTSINEIKILTFK